MLFFGLMPQPGVVWSPGRHSEVPRRALANRLQAVAKHASGTFRLHW